MQDHDSSQLTTLNSELVCLKKKNAKKTRLWVKSFELEFQKGTELNSSGPILLLLI